MLSPQRMGMRLTEPCLHLSGPSVAHTLGIVLDGFSIWLTLERIKSALKVVQDSGCVWCRFFQELNSQLFRTMRDAASSEDHILTSDMVDSLGLDPVRDRQFLTDLARTYNLNVNVQRPVDMFLCCV